MIETPRFNVFRTQVNANAWSGYSIFHRKQPPEKELRAEIARLWRGKAILAESGDSQRGSWILCTEPTPDKRPDLSYTSCPVDSVPEDILLNFILTARIDAPGGEPLYRTPSNKYWEAKKNTKSQTMVCFRPEFRPFANMQVLNVSATGFKVAHPGFASRKAVSVFTVGSDGNFESKGYRIPESGEIIKDPPVRNARPRLPWTPMYPEKSGPMDSKVGFISWLVTEINKSGLVTLDPVEIESRPIKELVGRRGMTSHLDKGKLLEAILSSIESTEIHLYDRRTEADNLGAWPVFVSAMRRASEGFGLSVTDRGTDPYAEAEALVFAAIDREAMFNEEGEVDTKPIAVASFPRPVQCFTGEIISKLSDSEDYEIPPSVVLVMLANAILKEEVSKRHLIMPREWLISGLTGSVGDYVFCDGFEVGEDKRFVGIRIDGGGSLEFLEEPTEGRLYETVRRRNLTPVFRRLESDPRRTEFTDAVEIRNTPTRALPLMTKKGMSGHFTGVRVVESLSAYYASGSDNPKSLKVEKALVLRQVERIGGDSNFDLEMMAGFCVDPSVRINAASVWPAPYKLLREYISTTN